MTKWTIVVYLQKFRDQAYFKDKMQSETFENINIILFEYADLTMVNRGNSDEMTYRDFISRSKSFC